MLKVPDKGFTHGGRFHADDVFSAALLKIVNPNIVIERGFTVPKDYDGIVFDIGDGEFDHHQKNSPMRENGAPYASFGLLWRELGEDLVGEEQAARVDRHFVQPLDIDDNTGSGSQVAQLIGAYNPTWDSEKDPKECFEHAVEIAKDLLWHKIEGLRGIARAADLVNEALKGMKNGIVILEKYAPWKQQLIPNEEATFVVYPSQRGGYCAQGVPVSFKGSELKVPFPAMWAGLDESELVACSNIDGLKFCHIGRFLITAKTKEDALKACEAAFEEFAENE